MLSFFSKLFQNNKKPILLTRNAPIQKAKKGITQSKILSIISESACPVTYTVICKELEIHRTTAEYHVSKLVDKGLVKRRKRYKGNGFVFSLNKKVA